MVEQGRRRDVIAKATLVVRAVGPPALQRESHPAYVVGFLEQCPHPIVLVRIEAQAPPLDTLWNPNHVEIQENYDFLIWRVLSAVMIEKSLNTVKATGSFGSLSEDLNKFKEVALTRRNEKCPPVDRRQESLVHGIQRRASEMAGSAAKSWSSAIR